jgi:hypothetical protein
MYDAGRLDHPGSLQLDLHAKMVEQADSPAEQDRYQVDLHLVEKSGPETLLGGCSAVKPDIFVARGRLGPFDGVLDAVGGEREHRRRGNPFRNAMREHETWHLTERATVPPTPRTFAQIVGPSAHHHRTGVPDQFIENLDVALGLPVEQPS